MYTSGSLTSHPIIIMNIYKSYKNKTGKMRPFLEAVRPLMPFVGFFIITSIWVLFSNNKISNLEPRCLFVIFGTVFSNFCVSFNLFICLVFLLIFNFSVD